MTRADTTSRAAAAFIDFLIVLGLSRLPDVVGFLAAAGFILMRDALFEGRSPGKKLVGIRVALTDAPDRAVGYRESILRNLTLALAYVLFMIPYLGWLLGPLALVTEILVAAGDERGLRIGDMLARTVTVQPAFPAPGTESRAKEPLRDDQREG